VFGQRGNAPTANQDAEAAAKYSMYTSDVKYRFSDKHAALLRELYNRAPAGLSLSESAAYALREAILDGVLPAHTPLVEEALVETFDISRTPVREALQRVTSERLIVRISGQAVVALITDEDVLAIYVLREALEGLAARVARLKAGPDLADELTVINQQLKASLDSGEMAKTLEMNVRFHRLICTAADSLYIDYFSTQLEHAVRRARANSGDRKDLVKALAMSVAEHEDIITGMRSDDPAAAEAATIRHLRLARERTMNRLRRNTYELLGGSRFSELAP
jgi:DNA-binding GntR family transcriptional regulator